MKHANNSVKSEEKRRGPRGMALPCLRSARERKNLSRQELANLSNLSQSFIYRLEQGSGSHQQRVAGWVTAIRLSQALGVPITDLTGQPSVVSLPD